MRYLIALACLVDASTLAGQSQSAPPPPEDAPPIEDNSFLVEEAFNQGRGVVQHINTFSRARGDQGWTYTFTQEWPLGGVTHQLSYTVPIARNGENPPGATGVGDIAVNYRYQIGGGSSSFAIAPRVSVLLPTGASHRALGAGGVAYQTNLPFSAKLTAGFVAHSNAGVTYTPRAHDPAGNSAATASLALGQSLIWLAHPKLNFMLEGTWTRAQEVVAQRQTARSTEFLLSPGLRGAIDFPSGLQVVPGIAFPFGVGSSRGSRAVFMYLSFEHPFGRQTP